MSNPFDRSPAAGDPHESPVGFSDTEPSGTMSAFLPILIIGLVLIAWFAFQATQLRMERDAMREAITNQDKAVADSKKLRDSLDAIARGTARLADGGNANARLIVDELKKRGITISPDQPTSGSAMDAPATPTK
ncbi:MAG: hypothetical protein ABI277_14915 [Burkholderiaceae bacterium]